MPPQTSILLLGSQNHLPNLLNSQSHICPLCPVHPLHDFAAWAGTRGWGKGWGPFVRGPVPYLILRILLVQVFALATVIASLHSTSACSMCKNHCCWQLSTPAPQGGAVQEAQCYSDWSQCYSLAKTVNTAMPAAAGRHCHACCCWASAGQGGHEKPHASYWVRLETRASMSLSSQELLRLRSLCWHGQEPIQ